MSNTVPVVKRSGIVFRPGDYSDKVCGVVTEEDIEAIAAASSEPVPVKSEHGHSLFDDRLGTVKNFRVAPDTTGTKVLWADWEEPEPLAQFLGDVKRRISAGFDDWRTRKISEVSLVKFPRVADAAFFSGLKAAFSAYESGDDVQPLQAPSVEFGYHTAEERDAIDPSDFADPDGKLFPIRTQDELDDAVRQVWHADDPSTVKQNILAIAERKKLKVRDYYPYSERGVSRPLSDDTSESDYYFSAAEPHSLDKKVNTPYNENQSRSHHAYEEINMSTATATPETQPEITPSTWEKIKASLGLSSQQVEEAQANFSKSPREIELERELNAMKQAQFSAGQQSREEQAKSLAKKLVEDKRIMPAQLESVTAEFSRALDDDAREPHAVKFSVEKDGKVQEVEVSRFNRLEEFYSTRPQHGRDEESVSNLPADAMALFSREKTELRGEQSAKFDADEYVEEMVANGVDRDTAVKMAAQYK